MLVSYKYYVHYSITTIKILLLYHSFICLLLYLALYCLIQSKLGQHWLGHIFVTSGLEFWVYIHYIICSYCTCIHIIIFMLYLTHL